MCQKSSLPQDAWSWRRQSPSPRTLSRFSKQQQIKKSPNKDTFVHNQLNMFPPQCSTKPLTRMWSWWDQAPMEVSTMCGKATMLIIINADQCLLCAIWARCWSTCKCRFLLFGACIHIQNLRVLFVFKIWGFLFIFRIFSFYSYYSKFEPVGKEKREADCNSIFVRPASIQGKNIEKEPFSWKQKYFILDPQNYNTLRILFLAFTFPN